MLPSKETVEIASWFVAIVGGLAAAYKGLRELSESRRLREHELRWKQAQLAREVLNSFFSNKFVRDATIMLDWYGREFEIGPNKKAEIVWADLPVALRTWGGPQVPFDDTQVYIRDCFDALFDGLELIEHYLRTGLLDFSDVQFPMAYHVKKLREHWNAMEPFMNRYGYSLALAFVDRFHGDSPTTANPPTTELSKSGRV